MKTVCEVLGVARSAVAVKRARPTGAMVAVPA